jgi:hypothetical protein
MSEDSTLKKLIERSTSRKMAELRQLTEAEREILSHFMSDLKTQLKKEVSTISHDISEQRLELLKQEKLLLISAKRTKQDLIKEHKDMKNGMKKSLYLSLLFPLLASGAMIVGSVLLGKYTDGKIGEMMTIRKEIKSLEATRDSLSGFRPIKKIWANGIDLKEGYRAEVEEADGGIFIKIRKEK